MRVEELQEARSAIAEEPRDALRQFKYYGRFWLLLTRSSANSEEPCEHNVSWNRVKCCTNVRRIACENVCNRWMTFKVIQGHCCCHHLIGHMTHTLLLVFHCKCIPVLHRFRDINTYLPKITKIKTSRDLNYAHLETVYHHHKTNSSRVKPCMKFDDSIFSHLEKFKGVQNFWNGSRDPGHAFLRDGRSSEG